MLIRTSSALLAALLCSVAGAADYQVHKVSVDLAKERNPDAAHWKGVEAIDISLLAQMMIRPLPEKRETENIQVQALHDGKTVSFRLTWKDTEKSEAGKLAEYSDAVALEFPVLDNANPPPIFMGAPKNPVHLFHWRAQYQFDEEKGKKSVKDIYPNVNVDIYPNEFPDRGNLKPATQEQLETFSPAVASGNPQASPKKAVDEILAEGFGTSAVQPGGHANGRGIWKEGQWSVVISRDLNCPGGSVLPIGKGSAFGVAVWQGGKNEVGSRKSITMVWTPFIIAEN